MVTLFRIHSEDFSPQEFNPTVPGPNSGGRFDTIDGDYAYLYAGETIRTAVHEVLLRDLPAAVTNRPRALPAAILEQRLLSTLTTTKRIELVDLRDADGLNAVYQDPWLVESDAGEYPCTREWARYIRACSPAAGFVWRSRQDRDTQAYVLFDDRLDDDVLQPVGPGAPIYAHPGRAIVDAALRRARVIIS